MAAAFLCYDLVLARNVFLFMQVFWAYIVGMLTSLGRMKLDRIHSTLKMFAMQGTGGKEFSQVISLMLIF